MFSISGINPGKREITYKVLKKICFYTATQNRFGTLNSLDDAF